MSERTLPDRCRDMLLLVKQGVPSADELKQLLAEAAEGIERRDAAIVELVETMENAAIVLFGDGWQCRACRAWVKADSPPNPFPHKPNCITRARKLLEEANDRTALDTPSP